MFSSSRLFHRWMSHYIHLRYNLFLFLQIYVCMLSYMLFMNTDVNMFVVIYTECLLVYGVYMSVCVVLVCMSLVCSSLWDHLSLSIAVSMLLIVISVSNLYTPSTKCAPSLPDPKQHRRQPWQLPCAPHSISTPIHHPTLFKNMIEKTPSS